MTKLCLLIGIASLAPMATIAFVPSVHSPLVSTRCSPTLQNKATIIITPAPHQIGAGLSYKDTAVKLAQQTDLEGKSSFVGPSGIFLLFAAMLGKLFFDIESSALPTTVGTIALLVVTGAVAYDNLIIGLGSNIFADATTDEKTRNILEILSYPRFIFHAVGLPFLYVTAAEIAKAAGVEWLQGELVQNLILVASGALAVLSRVRFYNSPGIVLADTSDSPPDALEHDLLWFTYKEPSFLYVLPSLVLAAWNIAVGVGAFRLDDVSDSHTAGIWLIASAVAVLLGNAKPPHVARFTGNLAEVVMLYCIFYSASLVTT